MSLCSLSRIPLYPILPPSLSFERKAMYFPGVVVTAMLLFCQQARAFVVPLHPARCARSEASRPATRLSYSPKSVQDVWDNHFAAFGGKDVSLSPLGGLRARSSATHYSLQLCDHSRPSGIPPQEALAM